MALGGVREGAGRKKGSTTGGTGYKNGRVVISCTKEQETKLKEMAKSEGLNVSTYILKKLLG